MRKISLLCLIFFMAVFLAWAVAAENQGAENMELNGNGSKGKVPFPHQKHQNVLQDCNSCHTTYPQKAGSIDELKADGKLAKKEIMNKQCIKCHKERKNSGETYGPLTCSKCHMR